MLTKIKHSFLGFFSIAVHVVIANENERVREVQVFVSRPKAKARLEVLQKIYGAANVCLASRNIIN